MSISKSFDNILLELDSDKKYINKEVFENTPSRIEEFYRDFFSGMKVNPMDFFKNSFDCDNNNIIIEKNLSFYSMCEHHFLPFFGKISLAYIPNKKIIGFGDIIKAIEILCKRPQLQERLTEEIANVIYEGLGAMGVFVIVEAEHLCMTMRGVRKPGTKIITSCEKGIFKDNSSKKLEVMTLLKLND
ncbi:GTP cyclohydrolase I FolE [Fusobacterium perfoetens]|uniref:GTP cyclohydrolase I FolE n=1 Tax=Fusobacterium perfoetens TaxID=852 RepID=UPI000483DD30|nr:GTP cyclohydrolase I FolE [Fusobacterium perfoetens]MCI6152666.1 GTP cyclohydrolase I FolE [Fusobacterium perfoetens]MDY3237682.1 GTP cyclohydrolase I FolE [Fusobacterium perfoetens]